MASFGNGSKFFPAKTLEEFITSLERPRRIFLMVQAGAPVDAVLDQIIPLLSSGDIVIDGGNSYFKDTIRREQKCAASGISFLGVGISGGEEGALNGPSIMPGGPRLAWEKIAPMLEKIAAYADGPCTAYMGPDGAGHFVKMVHNGIEYGDMQLIAEAYDVLKRVCGLGPEQLSNIFKEWNEGELQSFLIEVTYKVLQKKDPEGSGYLVDKILDKAGQKGTGKWTVQEALDLAVTVSTIAAAVDARVLSSLKDERIGASGQFESLRSVKAQDESGSLIKEVKDALYTAKILSYAQGMALLSAASRKYSWDLRLGEIAAIWKGGCIIRARFLDDIRRAYGEKSELTNLVLAESMKKELLARIPALRNVVAKAASKGIAVPAFSASLSYFESYTTAQLPQNLTQAQRDFFGAHTYERADKPGIFHTFWEST